MDAEHQVLPYTLCAITATAFMLNVILLAWHCLKFKGSPWLRLVKYSACCLDVSYVCTAVALSLLILYKDLEADALCKIGGVLILYSTQQSLWDLAAWGLCLLLWKRSQKPWQPAQLTREPSWARPVFVVVMAIKFVLVAIISIVPQLDIQHFDASYTEYYLCTPLRLPGEQSWGYSALMVILYWIALLVVMVTLVATVVSHWRSASTLRYGADRRDKQQELSLGMSITIGFNVMCWLVIILVTSISYFSEGDINQTRVKWTLGFCIGLTILLHPCLVFALNYMVRRQGCCRALWGRNRGEKTLGDCPQSLQSLVKHEDGEPADGLSRFVVQWYSKKDGQLHSGLMKVFSASSRTKWRNEVHALAKLDPAGHPNIARYTWQTQRNDYSAAIYTFTGLRLGPEASIVCRAHYPNGTLRQYLDSSIHRLTEVSLHKVTLDIASGLDYLHQRHLVHNGLTTHTVLMASVSEKVGLKAVLSDFENSYEVSPADEVSSDVTNHGVDPAATTRVKRLSDLQTCHDIFSIANPALEADRFAPDIRSFGLIVLEILVSLTEYNQRPPQSVANSEPISARHRLAATPGEQPEPHVHGPNTKCTCSSRVTEIRVCTDKAEELKLLPRNLLGLHGDDLSYERSENSVTSSSGVYTDRNTDSSSNENSVVSETDALSACHCAEGHHMPSAHRDVGHQREAVSQGHGHGDRLSLQDMGAGTSVDSGLGDGHCVETQTRTQTSTQTFTESDSRGLANEDACAASIGSFETIFEDQEHPAGLSGGKNIYMKNPTRLSTKPPPHIRRKAGDAQQQLHSLGGAKETRVSAASLDGTSIASMDSGLGSSHYDMQCDRSLQLWPIASRPGSRETIYSDNGHTSDVDSYSLVKGFVDRNNQVLMDTTSVEGPESNVDGSPILEEDFDIGEGFGLPDLRLRKQPCVATHDHVCPGHGPHTLQKPQHELLHSKDIGTESTTATVGRCSVDVHGQADEPVYAKVSPRGQRTEMVDQSTGMSDSEGTLRKQQSPTGSGMLDVSVQTQTIARPAHSARDHINHHSAPSPSAFAPPPCRQCPTCGNHKDHSSPVAPSPASLSDSRQFRRSANVLPKLGVSAYRGRRLSDCSVVSTQSQPSSTQLAIDRHPGVARQVRTATTRGVTNGNGRPTAARTHGRVPSVTPSAASTSSLQVSRSATSSVLSILQDSRMLIESLYGDPTTKQPSRSSALSSRATSVSSRPSRGVTSQTAPSRPGLGPGQIGYCQQLLQQHPALLKSTALMTSPSQQKLLNMLTGVQKKGHLGFTAGQLLPLLSDCWLEDPAPSAEDILRSLDHILPTAAV